MAETNENYSNVENTVSQMGEKAQQAASAAISKAQEVASAVSKRVDETAAAIGERIKSAGSALRERGPREGALGAATGTVADSLENTGRYIQDEGIHGMAQEITDLIRRNPIPAMLVGVGLGFLLARMLRK